MDEMLRNMTSRQLTEWQAFYVLEPFGYRALMYGFCVVAATLINLNMPKGKKHIEAAEILEIYAPAHDGTGKTGRVSGEHFFDALKKYAIKKKKKE